MLLAEIGNHKLMPDKIAVLGNDLAQMICAELVGKIICKLHSFKEDFLGF